PGQDDRTENVVAELDRPGESEQPSSAVRRSELELDALAREDPVEVENRARQQSEGGRRAARKEVDSLRALDVVDLVAGGTFELARVRWRATRVRGVDLIDPPCLVRELAERLFPHGGLGLAPRDAEHARGPHAPAEHDQRA